MAAIAIAAADWSVKQLEFSALSIGIAMINETTGWSSYIDNNGSGMRITKTVDGGETWTPVPNQTNPIMVLGVDVSNDPALDIVTTGMHATSHSADGDSFTASVGAPFMSQSIRAMGSGRVALASDSGPCLSTNGGRTFKCYQVPFKYGNWGRYVSWPSADVIYITAGNWPNSSSTNRMRQRQLTANLHVVTRSLHGAAGSAIGSTLALETRAPRPLDATQTQQAVQTSPGTAIGSPGYFAELWKSADGGASWTSLVTDEGRFYFNGIDCIDEIHCVAVAEGFGHDGSTAPGARVFTTSDGAAFRQSHLEDVDGSELMAVRMLSPTEHHVGGLLQGGVSLHSDDGGASYVKQGATVAARGQKITDMSFPTATHGFATSISRLQICSLLEYAN